MTTRQDVEKVAKALAKQRLYVQNLAMQNTQTDFEKRMEQDTRYIIETDLLAERRKEYDAILRRFISEGQTT